MKSPPARTEFFIVALFALLCLGNVVQSPRVSTLQKNAAMRQKRTVTRIIALPPLPGTTNQLTITNTFTISSAVVGTTNPPIKARTNIVVSFTSPVADIAPIPTNHGYQFVMVTGNWIQSATNLIGPWTNHFFVPASGSNVTISFPIDRTVPAKFFRLSSNLLTVLTNP